MNHVNEASPNPEGIKTLDHDFLRATHSLSHLHFQVCAFIFNKSLSPSRICLALEFFLAQRQEPDHHCSSLGHPCVQCKYQFFIEKKKYFCSSFTFIFVSYTLIISSIGLMRFKFTILPRPLASSMIVSISTRKKTIPVHLPFCDVSSH